MNDNYENWLIEQKYASGTVTAQKHRVGRVEQYYGDVDEQFSKDGLDKIISELSYSTQDERENRPNPSKIPIEGNIRSNLQSYRDAIKRYQRFLNDEGQTEFTKMHESSDQSAIDPPPNEERHKFSLERDMQASLRLNIESLSHGLRIIDDGAERSVDSGFIDITCEDSSDNAIVVIELKAGKADSRAIGQILGYMGDLKEEDPELLVRGILVAHDFDKRSAAASKVVPTLQIKQYSIEFQFSDKV